MRLTEFIEEHLDSHDLIDMADFVTGLVRDTDARIDQIAKDSIAIDYNGHRAVIYGSTFGAYEQSSGTAVAGPKGVTLAPGVKRDRLAISGYGLASTLARQLTGSSPGDQYNGRGSAFRADIRALKAAGF